MAVLSYALRRLAWTIPTLFGALVVIFFLTQAVPGNAALARVGLSVDPETIAAVKASMGIDQPIPVQFWIYLQNIFHGDLGHSWKTGNEVTFDLAQRIPATIELALLTLIITVPVGVALGVLAATWPGSWLDRTIQGYALLGMGIPVFWLGMMCIFVFYFLLGWVPPPSGRIGILDIAPPYVTGLYTVDSLIAGNLQLFGSVVSRLILPVASLVFVCAAPLVVMVYNIMGVQLRSDHIRAATAAGLPRGEVVRRFALKNIMIPVLTMVAHLSRLLLGGAVLVETVFAWPGVARYAVESMQVADLAPLQAVVLLITGLTIAINLIVDVSYFWIDPRVKVAA
ncbi:MAG: peptide transporter permease [Devosia sp.]|uniref:ABC transporter permease n=1 Tax=Devosia sp. TaxID=1871048 RepID=UPI00261B5FEA|nr:ABC transporter permease [Devosia sp.]MDB5541325.1 peptide transporter permease [Devosia sp.]